LHSDEKQLVQVRRRGYSFNRLAPYSTLDDYLPEIQRTWAAFVKFANPVLIRTIRLRYVNRISVPFEGDDSNASAALKQYMKVGPMWPGETNFALGGFLNQSRLVERGTSNRANVVLMTQGTEANKLNLILDISAWHQEDAEVGDWAAINTTIKILRTLKNRIFSGSFTKAGLELFQ